MVGIDLSGKRGVVLGVTNARSLGWTIARKLHQAGCTLAMTYQNEKMRSDVDKLRPHLGDCPIYEVDVTHDDHLERLFAAIGKEWGGLDYIVHSVAFAPRAAMEGRYLDTRREDWLTALEVSAYSLAAVAKYAEPLLSKEGAIVTLSYDAARRVVPRYNVMGIAKSALEANVKYLAADLGEKGVRVNAISAGPMRTVAARSIPGFTYMYKHAANLAPLRRNVHHEEVGNLGLFLLSPLASGITGEIMYVDAGYHIMSFRMED
ncbi:MAG: enoyl-ACP reductase [Acidobacteriota bacterium]